VKRRSGIKTNSIFNIYDLNTNTLVFSGRLVLNSQRNRIVAVYDNTTGLNCLLPMNNAAYDKADNAYPITIEGFNIESNRIKDFYGLSFNNFNIYNEDGYFLYNKLKYEVFKFLLVRLVIVI
jgi:hypothetical protein